MFELGAITLAQRLYCASMSSLAQRRAAIERRLIHPPPPEEIVVFLVTSIKKTVEVPGDAGGRIVPAFALEAHVETSPVALKKQLRQKAEGDHRLEHLRAFVLQVKPDGTPAILAEITSMGDVDAVPADPLKR